MLNLIYLFVNEPLLATNLVVRAQRWLREVDAKQRARERDDGAVVDHRPRRELPVPLPRRERRADSSRRGRRLAAEGAHLAIDHRRRGHRSRTTQRARGVRERRRPPRRRHRLAESARRAAVGDR